MDAQFLHEMFDHRDLVGQKQFVLYASIHRLAADAWIPRVSRNLPVKVFLMLNKVKTELKNYILDGVFMDKN